ncbi:rho gtpase activation protein [Anaeramoeba flamelloides]|uniref:Rho gtpase activation protein n=1 Tax=Anaeramoeba flamelloides TaxID=1746091 RepID=A0ABQ8YZF7_9EUKA|nr:rho gtpase activation protein [Anaeramoeba flamelloides]
MEEQKQKQKLKQPSIKTFEGFTLENYDNVFEYTYLDEDTFSSYSESEFVTDSESELEDDWRNVMEIAPLTTPSTVSVGTHLIVLTLEEHYHVTGDSSFESKNSKTNNNQNEKRNSFGLEGWRLVELNNVSNQKKNLKKKLQKQNENKTKKETAIFRSTQKQRSTTKLEFHENHIKSFRSPPNTKTGNNNGNDPNNNRQEEFHKLTALRILTTGVPILMGPLHPLYQASGSVLEKENSVENSDSTKAIIQDQLNKLQSMFGITLDGKKKPTSNSLMSQIGLSGAGTGAGVVLGERTNTDKKRSALGDLRAKALGQFQLQDYAREHFLIKPSRLKILRRKTPQFAISNSNSNSNSSPNSNTQMIKGFAYSPKKLQNSITKLSKGSHTKLALSIFKDLLYYMGEKKWLKKAAKRKTQSGEFFSQDDAIKNILEVGLNIKEMRDEIYLQIWKQTTQNPGLESTIRGWAAFCLVANTFAPSGRLSTSLSEMFTQLAENGPDRVNKFANLAKIRLRNILAPSSKQLQMPSDYSIKRILKAPHDPIMFNVTLKECFMNQNKKFPSLKIPYCLKFLIHKIIETGGMKQEGLFRVPGSVLQVKLLREMINRGEYIIKDEQMNNPNIYSSVLKLWLRQLHEPLFPLSRIDQLQNTVSSEEMVNIAEQLPQLVRYCLAYIIYFAQQLSQEEVVQHTKMDTHNLALMFAPNIVRLPKESLMLGVQLTEKRNFFITSLIQFWNVSSIIKQIKIAEKSQLKKNN